MKIQTIIYISAALLITDVVSGQVITSPNYGLKTPETMEVKKIEAGDSETVVYLSVVNQIKGGSFCADKNIVLTCSDGTKLKLLSAEGIPVCPEQYKFRFTGEKLDFVLRFPALKPGTEWIDIVEMCDNYCFSIYGITLNSILNARIDNIFGRIGKEAPSVIIPELVSLLNEIDNQNLGIEGLLYLTIIKLSKESGNESGAAEWYRKFKSSGSPSLAYYLQNLGSLGIRY